MVKQSRPIAILLVEGNPADAALVDSRLTESKFEFSLRTEESLAAAVKRLRLSHVDVVLLDLSLPDSQGLATFSKVHAVAGETPIVILSGGDDEDLAVRAVREGAQDYLLKSAIDGRTMNRAVRYAIERTRRERAERELAAAGAIHRRMLPRISFQRLGFDVSGQCVPANYAGGDYFDLFSMGKNRLGVVIADAAGHGIGPAITMSATRAVIRTLATIFPDVGEILTRAGSILAKDLTEKTFVALFVACLDASSRTIQFAAAGHSGLVLDASGRTKRLLKTADPPLGILKGQEYSASAEIPLEAHESLFLFTDGLTEREDRSGGHFGNRRLIEAVQARYSHGAQQMLEHVFHEVKMFAQGKRPSDDMTAVIVKVGYPVGTGVEVRKEKPVIAPVETHDSVETHDHFSIVEREGTIVLHLTDVEILSSQTCVDLQAELLNYVHSQKPSQMVVSLRDVARFSSAAINVFLRLKKALAAEQTAFKLCEMQPHIREAFKALNLDGSVFEIHNDIQDALNSF